MGVWGETIHCHEIASNCGMKYSEILRMASKLFKPEITSAFKRICLACSLLRNKNRLFNLSCINAMLCKTIFIKSFNLIYASIYSLNHNLISYTKTEYSLIKLKLSA